MEVRQSLAGCPVFKTGGVDEKFARWVRFPCASANSHFMQSDEVLSPLKLGAFLLRAPGIACGAQAPSNQHTLVSYPTKVHPVLMKCR